LETKSKRQLENLSRKSKSAGPHKTKAVVATKSKKAKAQAHTKTKTVVDKKTGAGHKKQTAVTQNLSRKSKSPGPNLNAGPPQKHKLEMKCLRLTSKGGEVTDHYVGKRGAWDASSWTVGR
jgi:hypothetical protein